MAHLDKREYEERFGETVGFCNIHRVRVADSNCERCYMEHECGACQKDNKDQETNSTYFQKY
jgi:hypothetical protein